MKYIPKHFNHEEDPRDHWSYSRQLSDDHNNHNSRNDAHSRSSRARRGSDASDTYGTYIYEMSPGDERHYRTTDPTRCKCRCCPHPRSRQDSGFSAKRSQEWTQIDAQGHTSNYPPYPSDYQRNYHRNARMPRDRQNAQDPCCMRPASRVPRPAKTRPHADVRDIIVGVADRTMERHLRARYGRLFPLAISPRNTTARDICLFLAPDQRRERVLVRWRDGELEPLDDLVPIEDLREEGTRLEVRTRKNVHWT